MSERRSKIQVAVDILRSIDRSGGRMKPTHILYKSNLSHKLMKSHLNMLLQKGFIEVDVSGGRTTYGITQKGRKFAAEFKKMERLSEAFGLPI